MLSANSVNIDFALTGGVHSAEDVLKAVMAGASVTTIASEFLQNGIIIKGEALQEFIESRLEDLKIKCVSAELEGKSVAIEHLQDITWKTDQVFLQVISNG